MAKSKAKGIVPPRSRSAVAARQAERTRRVGAMPLRRNPLQLRARNTVANILEAAEKLFVEYGYESVTTSRIADRCGISVGSLYQYFPDKRAIAIALLEETSARAAKSLREEIYRDINATHAEASQRAFGLLLKIYRQHEYILLKLTHEVPGLSKQTGEFKLERLLTSAARLFLEQRSRDAEVERIDAMVFVVGGVVHNTMRRLVARPPEDVSEAEVLDELSACLLAYYRSKSLDV